MPTPFTDAGIARPTLSEDEKPGKLQPVASKILMKILFAARMARFDLLRATQSLAPRVTKWSTECDVALHRLVSYIHCTKHHFLEGFIGDALMNANSGFLPTRIMQANMIARVPLAVPLCL